MCRCRFPDRRSPGALKKVADMMVADHVEQWLSEVSSNNGDEWKRDVDELLKVFNQYYR